MDALAYLIASIATQDAKLGSILSGAESRWRRGHDGWTWKQTHRGFEYFDKLKIAIFTSIKPDRDAYIQHDPSLRITIACHIGSKKYATTLCHNDIRPLDREFYFYPFTMTDLFAKFPKNVYVFPKHDILEIKFKDLWHRIRILLNRVASPVAMNPAPAPPAYEEPSFR